MYIVFSWAGSAFKNHERFGRRHFYRKAIKYVAIPVFGSGGVCKLVSREVQKVARVGVYVECKSAAGKNSYFLFSYVN